MAIGDGDRDRSVFDRRYELRHGAESSSDPDREHAKLDVFLAPFSSLPFDDACAATGRLGVVNEFSVNAKLLKTISGGWFRLAT